MKKILFATNVPSPYRVDFFNELGKYCDLTVCFERQSASDRDKKWVGAQVQSFTPIYLGSKPLGADRSVGLELTTYIRKHKNEIVILTNYASPSTIIAIIYCRLFQIPYYIEHDGGFNRKDSFLKGILKKFLLCGARAHFTTCNSSIEYLKSLGISATKIYKYPFTSLSESDLQNIFVSRPLHKMQISLQPTTQKPASTDRVLRSTRLEDSIYTDLRGADEALDAVERIAEKKLHSFPALSRDVYQSFYSLMPRRREDAELSAAARKFNAHILDHITQSEDYPTLKTVCEGRELPAYEAASEFIARTAGELDNLLGNIGGEKGALNTLERLEQSAETASMDLAALLEQMRRSAECSDTLEKAVIDAANTAESKRRQVEAVDRLIDAGLLRSKAAVGEIVAHAVSAAAERAEETGQIIAAWSDDPACMEKSEVNMHLLALVRESAALREISKYLGRFREIFAQGRRNGYAYGRGEKYSLELGNDLSRALSSELSMLAAPETLPQFLRKYQRKRIKQYKRREPIYKGSGDIICCLDESSSTAGEDAAWGKAVALTLLEIAGSGGRSFALVHFSGRDSFRTDVFQPGGCTAADRMAAAECFLGGGTNFETPMREALRLMEQEGFENADVVFITDGECALSDTFREELAKEQTAHRFTVTGVLLDQGSPGMDFSLRAFCQNVYRTSELVGDEIVRRLVSSRA